MIDMRVIWGHIEKGLCPFCKRPLVYYNGSLGYEAYRCYSCGLINDINGIHIEPVIQYGF